MKVPESLREEHEELFEALKSYSISKDEVGAAVRRLLKIFVPHLEKEEELAMPLLGALGGLASGEPIENPGELRRLYELYARQYDDMFREHVAIRQAIERVSRAAKAKSRGDILETLGALLLHARVEEEVLYPAALLAGKMSIGLTREGRELAAVQTQ